MMELGNWWYCLMTGDIQKNIDCPEYMHVQFTIDSDKYHSNKALSRPWLWWKLLFYESQLSWKRIETKFLHCFSLFLKSPLEKNCVNWTPCNKEHFCMIMFISRSYESLLGSIQVPLWIYYFSERRIRSWHCHFTDKLHLFTISLYIS